MSTASTNRLAFVDVETTGLNLLLHQVYEAAWAIDNQPTQVTYFDHTREHADPEALRIGGYYERKMDRFAVDPGETGRGLTDHQRAFVRDLTGATIVAENYCYDRVMLLRRLGFEPWHYRSIELSSVAMTVFNLDRPEGITKTADRLRAAGFDTIPKNDHTAEADVECLRACYNALRELRIAGRLAADPDDVRRWAI